MNKKVEERKDINMKELAFGMASIPDKLPEEFLRKNPLPKQFLAWTYCSSCGKVLPADLKLLVLLCECVKRFAGGGQCDPSKIDWTVNYIQSQSCSSCTGEIESYRVVPYK